MLFTRMSPLRALTAGSANFYKEAGRALMRITVVATAIGLSIVGLAVAADAQAAMNKVHTDIPAQDLGPALRTLAKERNFQIVYASKDVSSIRTHGAVGEYTADEALTQILAGTGLTYRYLDDKTVTVFPASSGAAQTSIHVDGQGGATSSDKGGKKESSGGFRVAQMDPGQTSSPSTVEKQEEQASKKKPVQLEEVVVTGTRLSLPTKEGPLPVQVYSREEIQSSGRTTIAEFLNTLPDVSIALHENDYQSFVGQATVRLHGLPLGTTLTLLNGRRLEGSTAGFFDLNNIPASAVERIEVVPVGSSAVYGSDALAGAVNIILRQNLSGLEVTAKQGHAAGSDETDANVAWGKSGEKGSISLIGDFQHRNPLYGQGRAITSSVDLPTGTAYPINDVCAPGTVYSLTGQNLPGLSSTQAAIPAGLTGTPSISDFLATSGKATLCNSNEHIVLIPPTQRFGGLLGAHYKVGEALDLFAEAMYAHEYQEYRIGDRIGTSASFGSVLSAGNPYNPFGQDVGISFADPNIPVSYNNTQSFVRSLIGARGGLFTDWHYEVSAYLSRDHSEVQGTFQNFNALNAALLSPDPATAINPFNGTAPGSAQLLQSLNGFDRTAYVDQLTGGQLLLRGTVLKLPAGSLQAAIGAEYGREQEFQVSTFYGAPTDLSRKSYSIFTEERVPLLAGRASRDAGDKLAITLAGRYDHSNDFGGKATYQAALEWRPIGSLLFRGDYATSYRAPALLELSGGQIAAFQFGPVNDPFRGNAAVPLVNVTLGANPNLNPETGHSQTLGLVYSSRRWEGLDGLLTYYNVDITNYITTPDIQTLVNYPNLFPGAVIRDPPSAQDTAQGYLGPITHINDNFFNFGHLRVSGVDVNLSYKIKSTLGEWIPSLAVANTYRWDAALSPGLPTVSYVSQGTFIGPGFSPRWKGNLGLAWKRGGCAASLTARYIGRYKDYQDLAANTNELGNFFFYDAHLRYDVGSHPGASLSWLAGTYFELGAVNLLNRLPEFSYNGTGFDPNEADIRGRFIYASIGAKW